MTVKTNKSIWLNIKFLLFLLYIINQLKNLKIKMNIFPRVVFFLKMIIYYNAIKKDILF